MVRQRHKDHAQNDDGSGADVALISGNNTIKKACKLHCPSVRRDAYSIIDGKGATYYGIGAALARLNRCILYEERTVFAACSVVPAVEGIADIALPLPHIIGRSGIHSTLQPTADEREKDALRESAALIKRSVTALEH
ncbi:hypothetical protein ACFS07_11635 [Undibacterium arcticum]